MIFILVPKNVGVQLNFRKMLHLPRKWVRQYLGCPASSATVERLFSQVGISFSKKRQSGQADTLESIAFVQANM